MFPWSSGGQRDLASYVVSVRSSVSSRSVLKITSFLLFIIVCFSQCYTILRNYLTYPTAINMYDESPSLISILPAITVCNNNRFSLKKLADRNETVRMALETRFPGWYKSQPMLLDVREFNLFRDEVDKLLDRLGYDVQYQMDNSTVDYSYSTRPDPRAFVKWIACGQTWLDSMDCGSITPIDSVRSRICSTFIHRGAMIHDAYNRPEVFNSSLQNVPKEHTYFDAKEVIKMVVDFDPEDYGDLKRQIGARILFHDRNFVAGSGDLDFFITRGYRYDFSIDRQDVKLMDEPYGDCYDYERSNSDKFKDHIDPRVPLTMETCLQNCIARNIVHRSKCWPPTMPYFRNDSLDPNLDLKPCGWFKKTHHISIFRELLRVDELRKAKELQAKRGNESLLAPLIQRKPPANKEMKFYKMIRRNCMAQCVLSCKMSEFTVTLTRSAWPTDANIMYDTTGKGRQLRHCCALVTVKFAHFHYQIQQYQAKYDLANTVGDLGGLLAFWLGLSIVSLYHALNKLIELCTGRIRNQGRN